MKKQMEGLTKKDRELKQLQFECESCEFKIYINLQDEIERKFPRTIKCLLCGRKQSTKRRIFKMVIEGYEDYDDSVCPTCDRVYEEVKK